MEEQITYQNVYHCEKCGDTGLVDVEVDGRAMMDYCKCHAIRKSLIALKKSGLQDSIKKCRFENFETDEPFRKEMKDLCERFLGQKESRFLYLGGQPGCGKTHIATALCGSYITRGARTIYTTHQILLQEMKTFALDEEYSAVLHKYADVTVLYIDDFFKPITETDRRSGQKVRIPPTAADIKHTFELINMRLVNNKITILTSELFIDEIIDIDEALGSRIKQKCGAEYAMNIAYAKGRNWRTRKA